MKTSPNPTIEICLSPAQHRFRFKQKDVKRRSRKRRTVKSKDLEVLISVATRAAHIARDKGFHVVSPEAIRCVEVLRMMRSLPLTPRVIVKTDALRSLQFLATNGNPKIRSESKSLLNHFKGVLAASS